MMQRDSKGKKIPVLHVGATNNQFSKRQSHDAVFLVPIGPVNLPISSCFATLCYARHRPAQPFQSPVPGCNGRGAGSHWQAGK